jgi:ketosteroid isomerase-like protein
MIDAFNRRDVHAFVEPTTSDFEWLPAIGMAVEGGNFRGRDGVEKYFGEVRDTWEEVRVIAEGFRDLGDGVLLLTRIEGHGRGSGVPVDAPFGAVFDCRADKISRLRSYLDHGEALRAAGLAE